MNIRSRVLIAVAVIVLLALFIVARNVASWRPQLVHQSERQSDRFVISPSARWMLCNGNAVNQKKLIDLRTNVSRESAIKGKFFKFTADEDAVFFHTSSGSNLFISLYELPAWNLRRSYRMPDSLVLARDVQFSADGTRLIAATDREIMEWDTKTGQLLGQRSYNLDYHPSWLIDEFIDESFSFVNARSEGILSKGGSLVTGGDKTFSTATGEIVGQASQIKTRPRSRFDVNQAQNFIRVTDRKSGEVVLLEDSLESHYSRDERWILNTERKGLIQLIDTKNWEIVARRNVAEYQDYSLELAPDYLLTTDDKGRVYRWRLR